MATFVFLTSKSTRVGTTSVWVFESVSVEAASYGAAHAEASKRAAPERVWCGYEVME